MRVLLNSILISTLLTLAVPTHAGRLLAVPNLSQSNTGAPVASVVDYLRETPASVSGEVRSTHSEDGLSLLVSEYRLK